MGESGPVKTRVLLLDPISYAVVWMNEAAAQAVPDWRPGEGAALPVERVVPMAEALGVPDALKQVAESGTARHLSTDVVSKSAGRIAMVVSIYRLPDGPLLLVAEHAWKVGREGAPRGRGR